VVFAAPPEPVQALPVAVMGTANKLDALFTLLGA